jgi:HEPN domain-containing protein
MNDACLATGAGVQLLCLCFSALDQRYARRSLLPELLQPLPAHLFRLMFSLGGEPFAIVAAHILVRKLRVVPVQDARSGGLLTGNFSTHHYKHATDAGGCLITPAECMEENSYQAAASQFYLWPKNMPTFHPAHAIAFGLKSLPRAPMFAHIRSSVAFFQQLPDEIQADRSLREQFFNLSLHPTFQLLEVRLGKAKTPADLVDDISALKELPFLASPFRSALVAPCNCYSAGDSGDHASVIDDLVPSPVQFLRAFPKLSALLGLNTDIGLEDVIVRFRQMAASTGQKPLNDQDRGIVKMLLMRARHQLPQLGPDAPAYAEQLLGLDETSNLVSLSTLADVWPAAIRLQQLTGMSTADCAAVFRASGWVPVHPDVAFAATDAQHLLESTPDEDKIVQALQGAANGTFSSSSGDDDSDSSSTLEFVNYIASFRALLRQPLFQAALQKIVNGHLASAYSSGLRSAQQQHHCAEDLMGLLADFLDVSWFLLPTAMIPSCVSIRNRVSGQLVPHPIDMSRAVPPYGALDVARNGDNLFVACKHANFPLIDALLVQQFSSTVLGGFTSELLREDIRMVIRALLNDRNSLETILARKSISVSVLSVSTEARPGDALSVESYLQLDRTLPCETTFHIGEIVAFHKAPLSGDLSGNVDSLRYARFEQATAGSNGLVSLTLDVGKARPIRLPAACVYRLLPQTSMLPAGETHANLPQPDVANIERLARLANMHQGDLAIAGLFARRLFSTYSAAWPDLSSQARSEAQERVQAAVRTLAASFSSLDSQRDLAHAYTSAHALEACFGTQLELVDRSLAAVWRTQAQTELEAARALKKARLWAPVVFHSFQSAEDAIKAVFIATNGIQPRELHSHDICSLASRLSLHCGSSVASTIFVAASRLAPYYTRCRYPNANFGKAPADTFSAALAKDALSAAETVLDFCTKAMTM